VDGRVVVLAPEERHEFVPLAVAEQVGGSDLALAFGDHPVLDANPLAAVRVGPAGNVAGRENVARAGLEELVDYDPVVDGQPGTFAKLGAGAHADAGDDEVSFDRTAALEDDALAVDCRGAVLEVEDDAMFLMPRADEVGELGAHDPLQRPPAGSNHMDLEIAVTERRGNLEPDEARAQDHDAARLRRKLDDAAAVAQGA